MRIITGSARGTKLKTPKGDTTRPTADRVKESLFNVLGQHVVEARVLDLFSGTGNLALEALSRGAESAVLVDAQTARLMRENAEKTHLIRRAEILLRDVFAALKAFDATGRKFDLIFADPPYHVGLSQRVLREVAESSLLEKDGLFILEQGADETVQDHSQLECVRNLRYGKTTQICIYRAKG